MFIKIVAMPNIPVLDGIPEEIRKRFVGLVMQARSESLFNGLSDKLEESERIEQEKIISRSLKPGQRYHLVPMVNVLGSVFENLEKTRELYTCLILPTDKLGGLIFGPDDVEVLKF